MSRDWAPLVYLADCTTSEPRPGVVSVTVTTNEGLCGHSEADLGSFAPLVRLAIQDIVAPDFVSYNPWGRSPLVRRALRRHDPTDSMICRAVCMVDAAVIDVVAQESGLATWDVLGGQTVRRGTFTARVGLERMVDESFDSYAQRLMTTWSDGPNGDSLRIAIAEAWEYQCDRTVPEIKRRLAYFASLQDMGRVHVAFNHLVLLPDAIALVEPFGVETIEDPQIDGCLTDQVVSMPVSVIGGSRARSGQELSDFAARTGISVLVVDLFRLGGPTMARSACVDLLARGNQVVIRSPCRVADRPLAVVTAQSLGRDQHRDVIIDTA